MCAGQLKNLDDELLDPIPAMQFEELMKRSRLGAKTKAAVRSVLVPPCDKDGFPIRGENGFATLNVNEAALANGLQPANLSRAVASVQKMWNRYLLVTGQVPAYGAVSPGFFKAMQTVQNEKLEGDPEQGKPKRGRRKKGPKDF